MYIEVLFRGHMAYYKFLLLYNYMYVYSCYQIVDLNIRAVERWFLYNISYLIKVLSLKRFRIQDQISNFRVRFIKIYVLHRTIQTLQTYNISHHRHHKKNESLVYVSQIKGTYQLTKKRYINPYFIMSSTSLVKQCLF